MSTLPPRTFRFIKYNYCFTKHVCSLKKVCNLSYVSVLVTVQCVKLVGFSILSRTVYTIITEQILLRVEVGHAFSPRIITSQSL